MRGLGVVRAGGVRRRGIVVAVAAVPVTPVPMALVTVAAARLRGVGPLRMRKVQRSQAAAAGGDERRRAEDEDGMHESAHRPPV